MTFSHLKSEAKEIQQMKTFLLKKRIDPALFIESKSGLTIASQFEKHVAWIFKNVLNKDLSIHGILHLARGAFLVPIFCNALRLLGNKKALELLDDSVLPLQITMLCHDLAREGDGVDIWDLDSALLLYYYLTRVLSYDKTKAAKWAEAIANKDAAAENYHSLQVVEGELTWVKAPVSEKSLEAIVIHECDCYEIARVHLFSITFSYLYNEYALNNEFAYFLVSLIRHELKSLMIRQGDFFDLTRHSIKDYYHCENVYSMILADVFKQDDEDKKSDSEIDIRECYKAFPLLYANGKLLSKEQIAQAKMDIEELRSGKKTLQPREKMHLTMRGKQVLDAYAKDGLIARGIAVPSYLVASEVKEKRKEPLGGKEIRKVTRRKFGKQGSLNRSAIFIHEKIHSEPYCGQFLLANVDFKKLKEIGLTNLNSGFFKKKEYVDPSLSEEEKREKLDKLISSEMMGGLGRERRDHHEIIADIEDYIGVAWTRGVTFHHTMLYKSPYPINPYAPLLQALFLQKEHENQTGIQLPIF